MSLFLACSHFGGALTCAVVLRLWVADCEIDQEARKTLQTPSLYVNLWGLAIRCCELWHYLLAACLISCLLGRTMQDVATLGVSSVGGSAGFAQDGMVPIRICRRIADLTCGSISAAARCVLAGARPHCGHTQAVACGENKLCICQGRSQIGPDSS